MCPFNQPWFRIIAVLVLSAACAPTEPPEPPEPPLSVPCPEPFEGIDRFTEMAAERGLTSRIPPVPETHKTSGGSVVAQDLDGDGDVDIILGRWSESPDIYRNEGNAHFQLLADSPVAPANASLEWQAHAAIDLDGDSLPDLVGVSGSQTYVWMNQSSTSGIAFSSPEPLIAPHESGISLTASFGDVDQDDDLDLVLAGFGHGEDPESPYLLEGSPDLLFLNEDGVFDGFQQFITGPLGSRTMVLI